jgi:hypothetical protein
MRLASSLHRAGAALVVAAVLAPLAHGCGSSSECVADLPTSCAPLYPPTFDQIFTNTLAPSCALSGSGCHAPEGGQGGLVFADADSAYALLLGKTDGRARVAPGDPACSLLIERLYATDPAQLMPRGAALPDAERCAFIHWIADGAKR